MEALITREPDVLRALASDGCRIAAATVAEWARETASVSLPRIDAGLSERQERIWWAERNVPDDLSVLGDLLHDDDDQPAVLFLRGSVAALRQPRVAVVGTRNATSAGREMARMLGRELSDRGVSVISGLALGIDAASHAGALASPGGMPVGVVGSGLDVVYPPANRRLWHHVAERGLLLSELAPTRGPTPGTFPARNRIIAQLAQVVVVVESAVSGGSLITVDRALERGRPVLAVPGSPLSPMSAGTNDLLRPGLLGPVALPCLSVADVLTLLDLEVVSDSGYVDDRSEPNPTDEVVLQALGWDELSVGGLAGRIASGQTVLSLAEVSLSLARLEQAGWVNRAAGRWRRAGIG